MVLMAFGHFSRELPGCSKLKYEKFGSSPVVIHLVLKVRLNSDFDFPPHSFGYAVLRRDQVLRRLHMVT